MRKIAETGGVPLFAKLRHEGVKLAGYVSPHVEHLRNLVQEKIGESNSRERAIVALLLLLFSLWAVLGLAGTAETIAQRAEQAGRERDALQQLAQRSLSVEQAQRMQGQFEQLVGMAYAGETFSIARLNALRNLQRLAGEASIRVPKFEHVVDARFADGYMLSLVELEGNFAWDSVGRFLQLLMQEEKMYFVESFSVAGTRYLQFRIRFQVILHETSS